jgi:uncharacterized RDD family membrane protein YckC
MNSEGPEQGHQESNPTDGAGSESEGTGSYGWAGGKADPAKRAVAVVIDGVIAVLIGFIPWVGGLVAAAYLVLRDGMELEFMDNRSVGKKLMKLRPVTADGGKVDMMMSVQRNWMFGFGGILSFLVYIPILGWLLMIPVGLLAMVIGIVEVIKVFTDEEGRRFGDVWAKTKVVEVDA